MRELSVAEQRYQAVLAVISDGLSVSQVAQKVGVARQTLHSWLARYEASGLEGLVDRSHRPVSCPHQMPAGADRTGDDWVSRRVCSNGIVCVCWQQVSVGRHHVGARCDVHVDGVLLRFWIGDQLVKSAARTSRGEVRNKRALRFREAP
jgi:hypothetical protein